jgi:protein-disulfide isomerase
MRKLMALAATLLLAGVCSAQQPAKTQATNSASTADEVTVNAWLQRMFGWNPEAKWQILSIAPTDVQGLTKVVYAISGEQRASVLYVTADGAHAIAGELIPFGADPFAPARKKLATSDTGISKGAKDARLTMYVFSDLQCPHCKNGEPVVEKLQQDVPGVKLVFQQFPIPSIHPWAMKAAEYSDCIGRIDADKAFAFNDAVFGQQEAITPENATEKLNGAAQQQGLDMVKISACAAAPATEQRVKQSIALGQSLGVDGTPTLFINGRKLMGFAEAPYEMLKQLVEYEAQQLK